MEFSPLRYAIWQVRSRLARRKQDFSGGLEPTVFNWLLYKEIHREHWWWTKGVGADLVAN
jgi:hypothetical protein